MRITVLVATCSLLLSVSASCGKSTAFDFDRQGPLELLEYLRLQPGRTGGFAIDVPKKGWIREEHLKGLFAPLDSTERCSAVIKSSSSHWPRESTIGREAAFMIEGFRRGEYPPALDAERLGEGIKNELRVWRTARGHS